MFVTTLVNGQYTDLVSVRDRGLAYGDGLFETIKVINGKAIYLFDHLARLAKGCRCLNISCDVREVEADVVQLLAGHYGKTTVSVLKIIITRQTTGRSYQTHRHAGCNRIVSLMDVTADYLPQQKEGVTVRVCDTRLSINPTLAGVKHLCRLENVLARAEWDNDEIAEGLLLDTQGRLIEGTMSNVFLIKEGYLYTPSLHRCGVEGIIRRQIMDKGAVQLGLKLFVCDLTLEDVYHSDEVFLCNSLIGIWPVTSVACQQKKIGDITRTVQNFIITQSGEH